MGASDRVRQGAVPICLPAALLHGNDGQLVARQQAISPDRHLKRFVPMHSLKIEEKQKPQTLEIQ